MKSKLPLRIRLTAQVIRLLAWLTNRKIQPGAFVGHTSAAVMLLTPDGYNIVLNPEAARKVGAALVEGYEFSRGSGT